MKMFYSYNVMKTISVLIPKLKTSEREIQISSTDQFASRNDNVSKRFVAIPYSPYLIHKALFQKKTLNSQKILVSVQ